MGYIGTTLYDNWTTITSKEPHLLHGKDRHLMANRLLRESISDARPSVIRLTASVAFT